MHKPAKDIYESNMSNSQKRLYKEEDYCWIRSEVHLVQHLVADGGQPDAPRMPQKQIMMVLAPLPSARFPAIGTWRRISTECGRLHTDVPQLHPRFQLLRHVNVSSCLLMCNGNVLPT